MTKYIAKPECWFKENTEVQLIEEYYTDGNGEKVGLFCGIYIIGSCNDEDRTEGGGYDTFWYNKGYKDGDEVEMNEVCRYDEFNIAE